MNEITMSIEDRVRSNDVLRKLLMNKLGEAEFIAAAKQLLENKLLSQCTPESVLGCLLNAAILGLKLSPSLGECWIIPRKMKVSEDAKGNAVFGWVATFQVGYKGWQTLAFKSGVVSHFAHGSIYTNDFYDRKFGTTTEITHIPAFGDRGLFLGVWATATMKNGLVVGDEVQFSQIEKHRKMSDTQTMYDESARKKVKSETPIGVWATHYEVMAARIPIANLCKRNLPKTEIIDKAIEADDSVTEVTDTEVIVKSANEIASSIESEDLLSLNESEVLTLHGDYKSEIDSCKSQAAIREIFDKQSIGMPQHIKSLYIDYCTKVGNKLPQS